MRWWTGVGAGGVVCASALAASAGVPWAVQSGPGDTVLTVDSGLRFPVPRPTDLPSVRDGQATLADLVKRGEHIWYFTAPLEGEPFGVPSEVFEMAAGPPTPWSRAPLFGLVEAMERSGLAMLPGESLPRGLVRVRSPNDVVTQNCAACHSGVVEGVLVPGVGNKWYDQRAIIRSARNVMAASLPLLRARPDSDGPLLVARTRTQLAKLERYDALYSTGCRDLAPGMITAARIWQLSSLLLTDPAQLHQPDAATRFACGATKPPPLNTLRFRNTLFWDGSVNSLWVAHWPMFDFFGFKQYERWERKVASADIEAMDAMVVFGTRSPSWESIMRTSVDQEAAQRGYAIFHQAQSCSGCHGTHGTDGMLRAFQPGIIPLEDVRTDPERTHAATDELLSRFTPYGWASVPRLEGREGYAPGYARSPLCSTFMNFPYLHTGAVPNLTQLLLPEEQRATAWWQTDFTDKVNVGFFTGSVPPLPPAVTEPPSGVFPAVLPAPPRVMRRQVRPEHVRGHSGPAFGTTLAPAERADLVDFLKTLRCPEEAGAFP